MIGNIGSAAFLSAKNSLSNAANTYQSTKKEVNDALVDDISTNGAMKQDLKNAYNQIKAMELDSRTKNANMYVNNIKAVNW